MEILNIDILNISSWIAVGIILSSLVSAFISQNSNSPGLRPFLASIIGSIIGGLASIPIYGSNLVDFDARSILTAAVGSVVLLIVERITAPSGGHIKTTS